MPWKLTENHYWVIANDWRKWTLCLFILFILIGLIIIQQSSNLLPGPPSLFFPSVSLQKKFTDPCFTLTTSTSALTVILSLSSFCDYSIVTPTEFWSGLLMKQSTHLILRCRLQVHFPLNENGFNTAGKNNIYYYFAYFFMHV